METQAILDKLDELLEEERMAIRTLRGPRVHSIACEKLALMQALDETKDRRDPQHIPRVKEIVRRLRHNGVLLVQAKSVLSEALRLKKARLASPILRTPPVEVQTPSRRLSIVG
jgi:flagellar biosynthesis/type III secretory pathway chaperone